MLRITKLTDYAVVVLANMTHPAGSKEADGAAHAARDVAARTRLPQPTVSKVLKQLARAGLVVSERGKKGGYRLAKAPGAITVLDIIDAVEGPIAVTECSTHTPGGCEFEGCCAMEASWVRINESIRNALSGITLESMAHPMGPELIPLRRLGLPAEA